MCVVSNISDFYQKQFPEQWPLVPSNPVYPIPEISRAEFDQLKREVESLKLLLKQAQKFDEDTGQPECETETKIAFLKKIATALDIDISDVFKQK